MLPLSHGALLTLALLADTAGAAEPRLARECAAASRIDLTAEPTEQAPGVCVNLDEPTTFVFGAPLPSGAVVLSDTRSMGFAQGEDFVTVYPKRNFLPGERVKLTVRFGDGSTPESAAFWLVGRTAQGARRVEVFRHSRSADALQREVAEARAEAGQCHEEKARLLAERTEPGGLMSAAWLERTGEIQSEDILTGLKQHPENALTVEAATSYSHSGTVVLRLRLFNPDTNPWTVVGVVLKDLTGVEMEALLWQQSAIPADTLGVVVIGLEKGSGKLACPCVMSLREAQGLRYIKLGNVTFPLNPTPEH